MNYNTLMTAARSIPCTKSEYTKIKSLLDATNNEGDEPTGIDCEFDATQGIYLFGEENANVDALPQQ